MFVGICLRLDEEVCAEQNLVDCAVGQDWVAFGWGEMKLPAEEVCFCIFHKVDGRCGSDVSGGEDSSEDPGCVDEVCIRRAVSVCEISIIVLLQRRWRVGLCDVSS